MEKQFVTYPIALALKELGFDEPCIALFKNKDEKLYHFSNAEGDGFIKAPLWQQVIDWFREEHSTIIIINPYHDLDAVSEVDQILWDFTLWDKEWNDISDYTYYHSYEEAREAAILEAIKIVKGEKNG